MFTYALFIPNTLRRAGVVIGFIAAAPMMLALLLKVRRLGRSERC